MFFSVILKIKELTNFSTRGETMAIKLETEHLCIEPLLMMTCLELKS